MATFAYSGRTRSGAERQRRARRGHDGCGRRGAAPRAGARHPDQPGEGEGRRQEGGEGRVEVDRPPKSLAVFTRQFSVMIDAGLPLVQCLEILGTQEEDKNFAAVILATRGEVEGRRVAGRRDEEATRRCSTRSSPT